MRGVTHPQFISRREGRYITPSANKHAMNYSPKPWTDKSKTGGKMQPPHMCNLVRASTCSNLFICLGLLDYCRSLGEGDFRPFVSLLPFCLFSHFYFHYVPTPPIPSPGSFRPSSHHLAIIPATSFLLFLSLLIPQIVCLLILEPIVFHIMAPEQKTTSSYSPPSQATDGRLGYLTNQQVEKLQQFWVKLYEIFDGKTAFDQSAPSSYKGQPLDDEEADRMSPDGSCINSINSNGSRNGSISINGGNYGAVATSTPPSPKSPKSSSGWLSNNSNNSSSISSSSSGNSRNRNSTVAPRFTGAQLHRTFWKLAMMEHPDMIVLKVPPFDSRY